MNVANVDLEKVTTLRGVLDILIEQMEKGNDGNKFTQRERAMIGHAFLAGAATVVTVASYEGQAPSKEDLEMRGKVLANYRSEVKAYENYQAQRLAAQN